METKKGTGDEPILRGSSVVPLIDRKVSAVESGFNLMSAGIIVFLMVLVVVEVIGRYIFNHPIQGHYEIVVALMAPLVFFGMAYTERAGGHIRMELFISKIPKGRFYYGLEIVLLLISLGVIGLFVFQGFKVTLFMHEIGNCSEILNFPDWPFQLTVVIGCFLLCIRFVIEIFQQVAHLMDYRRKKASKESKKR